jgi:hypothetical protein
MMRAELYRPVHVKTIMQPKLRMLLIHCKLLQSKASPLRTTHAVGCANFGLKAHGGTVNFYARPRTSPSPPRLADADLEGGFCSRVRQEIPGFIRNGRGQRKANNIPAAAFILGIYGVGN